MQAWFNTSNMTLAAYHFFKNTQHRPYSATGEYFFRYLSVHTLETNLDLWY